MYNLETRATLSTGYTTKANNRGGNYELTLQTRATLGTRYTTKVNKALKAKTMSNTDPTKKWTPVLGRVNSSCY